MCPFPFNAYNWENRQNKDVVKFIMFVRFWVPILTVGSCQNLTSLLFVQPVQAELLESGRAVVQSHYKYFTIIICRYVSTTCTTIQNDQFFRWAQFIHFKTLTKATLGVPVARDLTCFLLHVVAKPIALKSLKYLSVKLHFWPSYPITITFGCWIR